MSRSKTPSPVTLQKAKSAAGNRSLQPVMKPALPPPPRPWLPVIHEGHLGSLDIHTHVAAISFPQVVPAGRCWRVRTCPSGDEATDTRVSLETTWGTRTPPVQRQPPLPREENRNFYPQLAVSRWPLLPCWSSARESQVKQKVCIKARVSEHSKKMSRFQSKLTCFTKNQESLKPNEKR